jgi:hypothetical protein
MASAQLTKARPPVADSVEAWRLHTLLQAGYPLKVAERLARSSADLHRAVEMLEQGCEPQVVEKILT